MTLRTAFLIFALLSLAGCGSVTWNHRIQDTPENWTAIQSASKRFGFRVTYVREREMATRRELNNKAVGALGGIAGDRVVAKRIGEWIYFRVERWNRVGVLLGQAWDLRDVVPDKEKKLRGLIGAEPGVTMPTGTEGQSEDDFLPDEDTVEVPSDAPEYSETENLLH